MNRYLKPVISLLVLLTALSMIVFGASDGGFSDIAEKATKICFECIGLG